MTPGQILGSVTGGFLIEALGRRRSMMIDSLFFAIGCSAITFAPNFPVLLIGRFLTGIAAGASTVAVPIYVGEISHPGIRGFTGSVIMAAYCFGFAMALTLGAMMPWRWATGIAAATSAVSLVATFFCPESPVWLIRRERDEEARKMLLRLRGDRPDVIDEEHRRIQANVIVEIKEKKPSMLQRIRELRSPGFLKPFIFLNVVLDFGLEWAGFPILAFYMITIITVNNHTIITKNV